jgi:hypothetical protein
MARRRHRRRYNPDPVAAVAAAIPASVPAPVAKAAIAGAAAAASKTNPRRGKHRGRVRRIHAHAHSAFERAYRKRTRHGRTVGGYARGLKSARARRRRNCGRNPKHDGSPTRGESKAARRAARAGTPAVLIKVTPRVMDYAGVKIPVAPGESLRTYLHRLHQYKKRHAPDPSIYARMERARAVKEFRGPAWKARKQVMWHLGRRGTRKLKDLPGTRANPGQGRRTYRYKGGTYWVEFSPGAGENNYRYEVNGIGYFTTKTALAAHRGARRKIDASARGQSAHQMGGREHGYESGGYSGPIRDTRANPRKSGVRTSAEYEKFRRYWVAKAKDDPSAFERAFARSVLSEHGGRYSKVRSGYDPITGQRNPRRGKKSRRYRARSHSRHLASEYLRKRWRHGRSEHRVRSIRGLRHARRNPRNAPIERQDKATLRRIISDTSIPLTRGQKNAIGKVLCVHQGRLNPGRSRRRRRR